VTTLVCFFISHARLRAHWAPGPLLLGAAKQFLQNSGEIAPRDRGVVSFVGCLKIESRSAAL
jgi:hypothetical protein